MRLHLVAGLPPLPALPGPLPAVLRDSRLGRRALCWNSGLDSTLGKNRSQCSIKISTAWLQNLMSMMEATVSSRGRSRVGPKHTPRLDAVIRLISLFTATYR